jgi:hypothetical protein
VPHFEMTTALDVETTRAVASQVLEARGYDVSWENSWTGLGRRRFSTVDLILFSPHQGLTVLRLWRDGTNWWLFLDLLGGLWVEGATNRLANAVTEALTERELAMGLPG